MKSTSITMASAWFLLALLASTNAFTSHTSSARLYLQNLPWESNSRTLTPKPLATTSTLFQSSRAAPVETAPWSEGRSVPKGLRKLLSRGSSPLSPESAAKVPSYRKLGLFAASTVLIWLSEPLLSLVDTTVVGWTQGSRSLVQLASLGPATTLVDSALYMTYFLALCTTSLVTKGLAESDWRQLQERTAQIMTVAAFTGLTVLGVLWTAGPTLLASMAGPTCTPELLQYAIKYTRIRALVAPTAVMGLVAQSHCLACHNTAAPLLAVLVASVINVTGDLALAQYGVVGAATATAVASASASLLLLQRVKARLQVWRNKELEEHSRQAVPARQESKIVQELTALTLPANDTMTTVLEPAVQVSAPTLEAASTTKPQRVPFFTLPDRKSLWSLAVISGPLLVNMWAKIGSYSALTLKATQYGVAALAAHNILMRLFFFFACFGDAMGISAQAFLPVSLYPSDKPAFKATMKKLVVAAIAVAALNSAAAVNLLKSAGQYLAKDASMIGLMKGQSIWLGASLFLHPLIVLAEGTVIATRDYKNLMLTYAAACALHVWNLQRVNSFPGVWQGLLFFQAARFVAYGIFRSRQSPHAEAEAAVATA